MMQHSKEPAAVTRRSFIGAGLLAAAAPLFPPPAQVALPTAPRQNDAEIQAIEQRLACNCGCTLDVFTCRTTDFTCTYSPRLHREVLALRDSGKTAQQIIDTFVAKYGEKALMAPKPEGFNLAGYLLPGTLIVAAAAGLAFFIGRRKEAVAGATPGEKTGARPGSASSEELERLERELADVED